MSLPNPYYQDDYVTLYHGDCREILPELCTFDLLLTDPPYGIKENAHRVASRGKLAATTDCGNFDWDEKPIDKTTTDLICSKAKKNIIWGGNYFHVSPSRGWLVWDKKNGRNNFADCELAWTNLKMSVRKFTFLWNGMIRAGEARNKKRVHPTQKPLELMSWCLGFAPDAKTILDPFAGSETTGRAAKDLGRKCTLIEMDKKYCEIAANRMSQEVLDF